MKTLSILITVLLITTTASQAQMAVNDDGGNPDGSAMLDVKSTSKGFLPPRMTAEQRNQISTPAEGLLIFNTTSRCIEFYAEGYWNKIYGSTNISTVTNPTTGATWMDRNLGASQVATSSTDAAAYGDLFQWGRATEGHQIRTSGTTGTLADTSEPNQGNPWDGLFITPPGSTWNWLSPQEDNLWQGLSGVNNPCPRGFRIPTEAEWNAERLSWTSNDAAGAFGSVLKLTVAGDRDWAYGDLEHTGTTGYYWSSNTSGLYAQYILFSVTNAYTNLGFRAYGHSIRCIME